MGIEQLADGVKFEKIKLETSDKPFFPDSDRGSGIELPTIDFLIIEDNPFYDGEKMYSDSDRNFSEGPQWDETEFKKSEGSLEELPTDFVENEESRDVGNDETTESNNSESDELRNQEESDLPEYNEDGTRELTENEKQELKEKLGWSDDKLKKCTIDENGVIHYKTDRCDLEGKTSENGIPYERRTIEINGVKIEGVFPKFESAFDTQLNPDNYKSKAYAKECNAKLKEAIENDPELRSKFTPEQIKDIEEGRTPTGYVWHHNEEPGKMQLVKKEDHDKTIGGAAHTGGNSLWGADSVDKSKKGENF